MIEFCELSDSYSRAYDRAAIKFRGLEADINFNVSDYDEDLKQVCCCASSYVSVDFCCLFFWANL